LALLLAFMAAPEICCQPSKRDSELLNTDEECSTLLAAFQKKQT
jgi:hypothetical protein